MLHSVLLQISLNELGIYCDTCIYQAVIVDARMQYQGRGWLNYDRRFHQMAAADPTNKVIFN